MEILSLFTMIRCCLRCNTRLYTDVEDGKYQFSCDSCGFKWTEQAHIIRVPDGAKHGGIHSKPEILKKSIQEN